MVDKRISVVVPVKNEEEKIGGCLEAVFSQSIEPLMKGQRWITL